MVLLCTRCSEHTQSGMLHLAYSYVKVPPGSAKQGPFLEHHRSQTSSDCLWKVKRANKARGKVSLPSCGAHSWLLQGGSSFLVWKATPGSAGPPLGLSSKIWALRIVLDRILQRERTRYALFINYKGLAHTGMVAEKFQDHQSRGWRCRIANDVVLVQVQRPENQQRQWSEFQSESLQTGDPRREMFQLEFTLDLSQKA